MGNADPLAHVNAAIDQAQAKLENSDPALAPIFNKMRQLYVEADGATRAQVAALMTSNEAGVRPDMARVNAAVRDMRLKQGTEIFEKLKLEFPPDPANNQNNFEKAWNAVHEVARTKSILERVVTQVYDGGWKLSGILGAAAGIAGALYMGKQAGAGFGWETLLAVAVMTPAFAWGANKLAAYISGPSASTATADAKTPARSPEQEQSPALGMNGVTRDKNAPTADATHLSDALTGGLKPTSIPGMQANGPAQGKTA